MGDVPTFLLSHQHTPEECGAVVVSWRGFPSPLRGHPATASCAFGGHRIWWEVETPDREGALALLPQFVAQRTEVAQVTDLPIP